MSATSRLILIRLAILLALIFLILAALGVTAIVLPDRYWKSVAEYAGQQLTEREVHIGGLAIDRSLTPTLTLSNVIVENADWAGDAPLLDVSTLKLGIELSDLLKGRLSFTELTATGVELDIVRDTEGRGNWPFQGDSAVISPSDERLETTTPALSDDSTDAANNSGSAHSTDNTSENQSSHWVSWLNLGVIQLLIDDARVHYLDKGSLREHSIELAPLKLISTVSQPDEAMDHHRLSLEVDGRLDQQTLSMDGTIGPSRSNGAELHYPLKLDGKIDKTSFTAAGSWSGSTLGSAVALDIRHPTIDLGIQLETEDSSLLTTLFGWPVPEGWAPMKADAKLVGADGQFALQDIHASISGNSTLNATGSIDKLMPLNDVRLDLTASLHSLQEVSVYTPHQLPEIGPLKGQGELLWQNGKLMLQNAHTSYRGEYGTAVVTGHIDDLIHFDQVRLRADVDLPDFKVLELFTGVSLPQVDGVVASANLISVRARDLYARNLKASVTKDDVVIDASGSIDALFKNGAELDLTLESSLSSLSELDDWLGAELPAIGPLSVTASLTGARQNIALNDVTARFDDELLTGNLQSDVGYLNRLTDIAVDARLYTPSLQRLVDRLDLNSLIVSPVDQAVTATGQVRLTDNEIAFHQSTLETGDNRLEGNIMIQQFREPWQDKQISGDLTVVNLDLIDLLSAPGKAQADTTPSSADRLLPDTPLPLNLFAASDLDLDVRIERLRSKWLDISDASVDVQASGGVLTIGPFSGKVNNGQADVELAIDVTKATPKISAQIEVDEFDLSRAGVFQGSDLIENTGGTRGKLRLQAQGDSLATIMSTASGEGGLYVENLLFKRGFLRLVSTDLIEQLIEEINPFSQQDRDTRFSCGALAFQMNNGVMKTPYGFGLDASDFTITGLGEVDFNTEAIDIQFNTKAKSGIGLGLGTLTRLVKLDGTLAAPTLSLNESELLSFGTTVAAAVATSGLTLLAQGLWDRRQADSDVCASAMGGDE